MRTSKLACFAFLFLLTLFSASQVRADGTDFYTYTAAGNTFTWQLPSQPSNPQEVSLGESFTFETITILENGVSSITGTMDFFSPDSLGGFDFWIGSSSDPTWLIDSIGAQLYSGSENSPTMSTGTFTLTDYGNAQIGPDSPSYTGTLQVTEAPEPSALLLLLVGGALTLAATALRRA
jgi:hypothetical protein